MALQRWNARARAVFVVAVLVALGCTEETIPDSDDGGPDLTGGGGSGAGASGSGGAPPSSSGAAGATSASGAAGPGNGGATSTATSASGGAPPCVDAGVGEPNETEDAAHALKPTAIDDCDSSGDTVSGTLKGASDVDWYRYEGNDTALCVEDAERKVAQSESGIRVCKYIECVTGLTEVTCPNGTTNDKSPLGRLGCCAPGGFTIDTFNCTGTLDEHVYVYIRVDQPSATAATCNDYQLDYHY
jgi:hypothetical protein